jgi:DNA-binding beta-propeller fold protein YncE
MLWTNRLFLVATATVAALATITIRGHASDFATDQGGGKIESASYREVENWAQLPSGTKWGGVASVAVDGKGNVYAFQRADADSKVPARVTVFDASGRHVTTWGQDAFAFPHGLRILRDGNVWTTDRQGQQVLKFDLSGKQLFSIGQKNVAGDMKATDAFNGPTDVTMAENGNVFISDGEGPNTRVLKFSKDGKFIAMWGSKGGEAGQLQTPHCVAIDPKGRVYVCDRGNKRVQVFDQDGKYLEQMSQFAAPVSIVFKDNLMYVAAGAPESSVWIATPEGKVIDTIKGLRESPHMIAVAPDGTIYVAAAGGGEGSLVKLKKK